MYALTSRLCWPDAFDLTTVLIFVGLSLGLPVLGYYFMVIDFRAWLRALRCALVRVVHYLPNRQPIWVYQNTPLCLRALGLTTPCTQEEVKRAYRRLAERLHPDRGGDKRRFLLIHRHFEKAIRYVGSHRPLST